MASSCDCPQKSLSALNPAHTAGRRGELNIKQRFPPDRLTQRTPAGLPPGIPGIGDDIDGAIQQAPQPGLHEINDDILLVCYVIDKANNEPCKIIEIREGRYGSRAIVYIVIML